MSRIYKASGVERAPGSKNLEPTYPQVTYVLDGITYLPHYTRQKYVGPGFDKTLKAYKEEELLAAGAVLKTEHLWKRPDQYMNLGEVK
jgi:hypothetical protein